MSKRLIAMIVLLGLLPGCSMAKLTPQGASVKITKGEPSGCESLGDVYGTGNSFAGPSGNMEYARNDIRNKAAELGANTVSFDTGTNTGGRIDLVGQAYKCPQ